MLRDDIVRGIRAGSILLALLLAGYAAYRVMHEPAAVAEKPATAAPAPVPLKPRPAAPVLTEPKGGSVPPPPPVRAGRAPRRTSAQSLAVQTAPVITPIESNEENAATGISEPVAAEEERQTSLTNEPVEREPVAGDALLPPETRRRRMMKAVGRFLHIAPRKDLTQQSIRQQ